MTTRGPIQEKFLRHFNLKLMTRYYGVQVKVTEASTEEINMGTTEKSTSLR